MDSFPIIRHLIAGDLRRDFIITPDGKAHLDVPGGNLLYAAVGVAVWESGVGLVSRVGEDYPLEWLDQAVGHGFDKRGIHVAPDNVDLRNFVAYTDHETRATENPVTHFTRLKLTFPESLFGYHAPNPQPNSRNQAGFHTIRINEIPSDYFDATAAHLGPIDYLSHSLLPPVLRQGNVTTITVDPAPGYMNPTFWDDIPAVVNGITAFISSEEKMRSLFQVRSTDLWEMAETIAGYGCETVVIKRGSSGQMVYDRASRTRWIVPAYPVQVVADPTGAGDAFCGGFLAGYRNLYDPLEAALHGNISASLVIEGSSPYYALDALPGLAQARLEVLRNMARRA
jgi:sugar/nucleoside kinase (ribokinase family)